jgi:hypothetical protein
LGLHNRLYPPLTTFLTLFLTFSEQPQVQKKAEEEGFQYAVAKTSFKANSKALAENEGDGMAKVGLPAGVSCSTYRASFNGYLLGSSGNLWDERFGRCYNLLAVPIADCQAVPELQAVNCVFHKFGKLVKPEVARALRIYFLYD